MGTQNTAGDPGCLVLDPVLKRILFKVIFQESDFEKDSPAKRKIMPYNASPKSAAGNLSIKEFSQWEDSEVSKFHLEAL